MSKFEFDWAKGEQLLEAGARGVVAMTYSVYVQTAVHFMARLYEALINGQELARSVALAREDLRSNPLRFSPVGEIPLHDWVVPALFEAIPVKTVPQPLQALRLDSNLLHDEQAAAGTEIDCPEPPAHGFVGQDGLILTLERAFQTETIVLLDGMAGIGKTQAAVGFARWRGETGALEGAVFFFSFERSPSLEKICDRIEGLQQVIKEQLYKEWHLLGHPEERRLTVVDILRRVPCLMIWDNFELVAGFPTGTPSVWMPDEQQAFRDFLHSLHCGRTKVLLTSRRDESWLGINDPIKLEGLNLLETQELAVRVLQKAGISPQQIRALPQYNDLLRYLRGNPLAIQIVLPELQRTDPDILLKELQSGELRLRADDSAQGRDGPLTASLTYRLNLFDPTLHKRIGVLGMFQGFINARVLGVMCSSEDTPELIRGLGRQEWAGILDKLADIGLLRKTKGGDYVAHPTLPWFFNNSLRLTFADHLIWLERTFTAVYKQASLEFNELFNINTRLAMSVLRSEEENLLYALRLALRHRCWDGAEGLLYGLNRLFTTQYRWAEWEQIIGSLESRIAGASGRALARQKNLRRAIQGYKAQIFRYFGDVRSARVIDTELLEDYAPDDHNLATALYNIGESAHREGNQEEAKRHYLQCLAIERRINDKLNQARTRNSLGAVAQAQSQWTEAEHWYVQSLPLKEELGDEKGRVRTLNNIGTLAEREGKLTEASLWYLQSLDIVRDMDDRPEECQILQNLGALAGEQEQWQEAERWLRQGLAIAENIHDDRTKAFIFHNLGNVALAQEAIDEAERWYRQSLAIRECIGDEHGKAETLFQLALIAEIRGNREEAVRLCQQAESIFKRFNDQYALEKVRQFLQRIQSGVQS